MGFVDQDKQEIDRIAVHQELSAPVRRGLRKIHQHATVVRSQLQQTPQCLLVDDTRLAVVGAQAHVKLHVGDCPPVGPRLSQDLEGNCAEQAGGRNERQGNEHPGMILFMQILLSRPRRAPQRFAAVRRPGEQGRHAGRPPAATRRFQGSLKAWSEEDCQRGGGHPRAPAAWARGPGH